MVLWDLFCQRHWREEVGLIDNPQVNTRPHIKKLTKRHEWKNKTPTGSRRSAAVSVLIKRGFCDGSARDERFRVSPCERKQTRRFTFTSGLFSSGSSHRKAAFAQCNLSKHTRRTPAARRDARDAAGTVPLKSPTRTRVTAPVGVAFKTEEQRSFIIVKLFKIIYKLKNIILINYTILLKY